MRDVLFTKVINYNLMSSCLYTIPIIQKQVYNYNNVLRTRKQFPSALQQLSKKKKKKNSFTANNQFFIRSLKIIKVESLMKYFVWTKIERMMYRD